MQVSGKAAGRRSFERLFGVCLAIVALLSASCATFVSGRTQEVSFDSTPEGAEVQVNGAPVGFTPLTVKLVREDSAYVLVRKPGYVDHTMWLTTRKNGYALANVSSGTLVGGVSSAVDAATGAAHIYEPDAYHVALRPKSASRDELREWSSAHRLRGFMMIFHAQIGAELSSGVHAEFVPALRTMLGFEVASEELRLLYFSTEGALGAEPIRFAQAVLAARDRGALGPMAEATAVLSRGSEPSQE